MSIMQIQQNRTRRLHSGIKWEGDEKKNLHYLFICLHECVPSNLTGFEILTILENSLLSSSKECAVPQNIHTHHMEGYQYWKFQVGEGHKSQSFQKKV